MFHLCCCRLLTIYGPAGTKALLDGALNYLPGSEAIIVWSLCDAGLQKFARSGQMGRRCPGDP